MVSLPRAARRSASFTLAGATVLALAAAVPPRRRSARRGAIVACDSIQPLLAQRKSIAASCRAGKKKIDARVRLHRLHPAGRERGGHRQVRRYEQGLVPDPGQLRLGRQGGPRQARRDPRPRLHLCGEGGGSGEGARSPAMAAAAAAFSAAALTGQLVMPQGAL
jgi:hypothetical protein